MNVADKFRLDGRLGVLTGGGGLLGTQYTAALLQAGAKLAVLDVSTSCLNKLEELIGHNAQGSLLPLECDIRDEPKIMKARDKIFESFGKYPDFLINNAAIDPKFDESCSQNHPSRLEKLPIEQWNLEIAVGLTGAWLCSRVFGVPMAEANYGVIINIASDLAFISPDQRIYQKSGLMQNAQMVKPVTYSVIKHGIVGLTKYIATYWAKDGVRCNAFAPGGVYNSHSDEFVERITQRIPMGRMAALEEYRATIVYLCSDASSYMNGAVLKMDGGRTVW